MAKKGDDKDAKGQTAEKAPAKGKKGLLKWIILLVLLLGLGGGGYFAYMKYFKAPPAEHAEGEEAHAEAPKAEDKGHGAKAEKGKEGEKPGANMVTLNPFIVNLADPQGRRYLKLSMDVETKNADTAKQLTESQARIRDAVILLLSSKSFTDLSSLENKILLKEEIAERLNQILGGPKVTKVYFTELVIQ